MEKRWLISIFLNPTYLRGVLRTVEKQSGIRSSKRNNTQLLCAPSTENRNDGKNKNDKDCEKPIWNEKRQLLGI
jgi:hypothetical protein